MALPAVTSDWQLFSEPAPLTPHFILQVQLVLNAFSVGCAGFSVLTPYRAVFVGLTATSLGVSHLRHRQVIDLLHQQCT